MSNKITIVIENEYTAEIKYNLNGTLDVKAITVKPSPASSDINYLCDVVVDPGETIATESTILKYFDYCQINGKRIVDCFTEAILNEKLHG